MPPLHDKDHLRYQRGITKEPFRPVGSGGSGTSPQRLDPQTHAVRLRAAVDQAYVTAQQRLAERDPEVASGEPRIYLTFELEGDDPSALTSLESSRRQAEVAAVLSQESGTIATLVVPESQAERYIQDLNTKIAAYGSSEGGQNRALISRLESAFSETLRPIFTDAPDEFPAAGAEVWWEVWTTPESLQALETVARRLELPLGEGRVRFPDRVVVAIRATSEGLERLFVNSSAVVELRLAHDTPEGFLDLPNTDQVEWSDELLERVRREPTEQEVAVLVLDGGTTRAHRLLAPFLHLNDWRAYVTSWLPDDNSKIRSIRGHGTAMAGLALYGDLTPVLLSTEPIVIRHLLETVKILPPRNVTPTPYTLYGAVTRQSIEGMEILNPTRRRVVCMAITTSKGTRFGRPSSWSGAIDQLAFGEDDEDYRRLLVLAAGNLQDTINPALYPDYIDLNREVTSQIENPAQAWNALTVGAYTLKDQVPPGLIGHMPYAPVGDLSPISRTSYAWDPQWPIKPDVVLEGGNLVSDGTYTSSIDSLSLLTTGYDPSVNQFAPFRDTSAATALAAQMGAELFADDPTRWPETTRGLIVHSAEWTPAMRRRLGRATMSEKVDVLRHYGYGAPDLIRARRSAANDVTLITEARLKPFRQVGNDMQLGEMALHTLPWISADLADLENTLLEMRVTLSYFIEPNPSERGQGIRFRYASHGLRFDLKGRAEDPAHFRQRVNAVARMEGNYAPGAPGASANWAIGPKIRQSAGSVFSDWWQGPAVELAECDALAVYPTSGWWKAKVRPPYSDREARYSLIITLRTVDRDSTVDIYTPIATVIQAQVETVVEQ